MVTLILLITCLIVQVLIWPCIVCKPTNFIICSPPECNLPRCLPMTSSVKVRNQSFLYISTELLVGILSWLEIAILRRAGVKKIMMQCHARLLSNESLVDLRYWWHIVPAIKTCESSTSQIVQLVLSLILLIFDAGERCAVPPDLKVFPLSSMDECASSCSGEGYSYFNFYPAERACQCYFGPCFELEEDQSAIYSVITPEEFVSHDRCIVCICMGFLIPTCE